MDDVELALFERGVEALEKIADALNALARDARAEESELRELRRVCSSPTSNS